MDAQPSFHIFDLPLGNGLVGISVMPGRSGKFDADIGAIADWGADHVLTMTTKSELETASATHIRSVLQERDIHWHHLPITDFGAPDMVTDAHWRALSPNLRTALDQGGRVLAHCWGGQGRSGMIILRLMVEAGEQPEAAISRLRSVRPGAVETQAQLKWACTP